MSEKLKAVLYIIGGVALLILGAVIRGSLFHRRGLRGTDGHLDSVGDSQRAASGASDDIKDAIDDSTASADEIGHGVDRGAELLRRGREILERGKKSDGV